jgi:hypothetical protein
MAHSGGFQGPVWTSPAEQILYESRSYQITLCRISRAGGRDFGPTIPAGGERGLVSLPVFKTGAPGTPRWAGSIPVRLRSLRSLRRTRPGESPSATSLLLLPGLLDSRTGPHLLPDACFALLQHSQVRTKTLLVTPPRILEGKVGPGPSCSRGLRATGLRGRPAG